MTLWRGSCITSSPNRSFTASITAGFTMCFWRLSETQSNKASFGMTSGINRKRRSQNRVTYDVLEHVVMVSFRMDVIFKIKGIYGMLTIWISLVFQLWEDYAESLQSNPTQPQIQPLLRLQEWPWRGLGSELTKRTVKNPSLERVDWRGIRSE